MKIKILETSKTVSPFITGDVVDIGFKIKDKMKFFILAAPEAGKTPISSEIPIPETQTEVTNFTFYNPTPYNSLNTNYVGARYRINGYTGQTYASFEQNDAGTNVSNSILIPIITTNTGDTLDGIYTVYTENSEIWQSGQTFDIINKSTIIDELGITFSIEGYYPNLGIPKEITPGYHITLVPPSKLLDNNFIKDKKIVDLDIRSIKYNYQAEYPSTFLESANIYNIYMPRLNTFFKRFNTSAFYIAYGVPGLDIQGQYNYLVDFNKRVSNFLIKIKDKFFTYYDRLNYNKQNSDIPEYFKESNWDLYESMRAGYGSPFPNQMLYQKNSLLYDYCEFPLPDESVMGITITGSCWWEGNNLNFNISGNGNDTDVVIGPESISGIEGYPYPKYDWIYYDWAVYGVDKTTNEMVELGVAFNQQSEEVWEKLDNFNIVLEDGAYGEYIQPGKKIIILCKAYSYKRSALYQAGNEFSSTLNFDNLFYGGIDPVTGCWTGGVTFAWGAEGPLEELFLVPTSTPTIKANWAWSYITVPEQGTATFQNPLSIVSEDTNKPISSSFLLFYDGVTADSINYPFTSLTQPVTDGRRPSAKYDAMGARFMPFVLLSDPYYLDPTRTTGWTAGSPYDYVTKKEISGLVDSLVLQGVTKDTNCYAYINWHEDSREFLLFPSGGGYTGPANSTQSQQREILARTMTSVLVGGTGTDGITFNGLKSYFPNVKWGFADQPKWPFYFFNGDVTPTNIWDITDTQKTQIMNHSADVFLSYAPLIDAIDMLMPHAYSVVNNKEFVRKHSKNCVELCKIINQKLIDQGKQPKKIIPFVSPIYLTEQTGFPYTVFNYEPVFPNHQYVPPDTIMLNDEILYEQVDPIVRTGADGAMIWLSNAFRSRQILGRPLSSTEDVVWGTNYWMMGPTAGITNPWSYKSTSRQAIVAHDAYIKYNYDSSNTHKNRWWWTGPGSTGLDLNYAPIEWAPLGTNKAYPTPGATSGMTAIEMVERILEDAKTRTINIFNDLLKFYKNG